MAVCCCPSGAQPDGLELLPDTNSSIYVNFPFLPVSRKRTFCERVNGKKREIYVYSIVPTKPSPSIHRAFFKHSPCFLQAFTGYGMGRRHHLALRIFHSAYRRNKSGLRRNKSGLRKNKSRTCAHNSWTCCRRFRRGEAETVKLR